MFFFANSRRRQVSLLSGAHISINNVTEDLVGDHTVNLVLPLIKLILYIAVPGCTNTGVENLR